MPGNVVRIDEGEGVPCDVVLIHSNDSTGVCYVETRSLDGETNLKCKNGKERLNEYYKSEHDLCNLSGELYCKEPNEFIYEFDARLKLDNSLYLIKLDHNNFLLRGCSLKRTKQIFCIAVYTGHNTKIMKNSPGAKSKIS